MPRKNPAAVALGKLSSSRKAVTSAANGRRSKGRPAEYAMLAVGDRHLSLRQRDGDTWHTPRLLSVRALAYVARWLQRHQPDTLITRIEGGTVYYDPA